MASTTDLRVSRIHHPVTALGPGRRIGIWTQGCSIGCTGCISQDTWSDTGGFWYPVKDLSTLVASRIEERGYTGVTLSGGEPFDQPDALAELLTGLRGSTSEVDLLGYSGYSLAWLKRHRTTALGLLDGIITGPYRRDAPTRLIWRGSANQEFHVLTDLGQARYEQFVNLETEHAPMQASVDDQVWMIGVPRAGDMVRLSDLMARRGICLEDVSWRS